MQGKRCRKATKDKSRSPCGERGLKCGRDALSSARSASLPVRGAWVEITEKVDGAVALVVAPRAGSVG